MMFTKEAVERKAKEIMAEGPSSEDIDKILELINTITGTSHAKRLLKKASDQEDLKQAALITIATACLLRAAFEEK